MARPNREERQRQQALQDLSTGLARGDAERAVSALLRLPAPERASGLADVAPLFRATVAREFRAGSWSRLVFYAARAEREPRLLAENAAAEDEREAHWALMWGAARSREWARARLHLSAVAAHLPPRLAAAIQAYLAADGAPEPELFLALRPPPPERPADPRLGYDPGQRAASRNASARAPVGPEEVEPAVLASRALLGSAEFVVAMERWADGVPPGLAPALLTLAARLIAGEVCARFVAGAPAWEPARAVARFFRRLGAPAELAAEATLALRAAGAAARERSEGLGREEALSFAEIVGAAALLPGLRGAAVALAAHTPFAIEARSIALDMLKELCELPDGSPLLLKALGVWATRAEPGACPPPWIERGFTQLLDRQGELARCLREVPLRTQQAAVVTAPASLRVADAERFLDQAWSWADDGAKQALLDGFDELLSRVRATQGRPPALPPALLQGLLLEMAAEMGMEPNEGELREMLDSPMGRQLARRMMAGAMPETGERLPEEARRLWDRFAERIVPYRISYLETALENSKGKVERDRAAERYLGDRSGDALTMLEAIRSAEREECPRASKVMLERLVGRLKGDRDGLARALLEAGRLCLRRGIREPLARAFEAVDTQARARGESESRDVAPARLEASLLDRRRRPSRANSRGRPAKKKRAAGRKQRYEQQILPLEQSGTRR